MGFTPEGLEINPQMADRARRLGFRVMQGRIEDIDRAPGEPRFDAVTLCDVLEHIPTPLSTLRKLRSWMVSGGTLLIRGPLNNDPMTWVKESARRLVGATKQLRGYPLDANVFNPKSLSIMLSQAGFMVPEWRGQTKGFGNAISRAV